MCGVGALWACMAYAQNPPAERSAVALPGAPGIMVVLPGVKTPPGQPSAPGAPPAAEEAPAEKPIDTAHIPSLFYSPDEMDALRSALALHERTLGAQPGDAPGVVPHIDASGAPGAAPPKTYTYPQFFLQSLEYHGPQNWVVRINNIKIMPDTPASPDLRIVALDKDKVTFQWKPADIDRVKDSWESTQHTDQVLFDTAHGIVNFTLHHNQTFSAYLMRVLEGKVEPVVVENLSAGSLDTVKKPLKNPDAGLNDSPAAPAPAAAAKPGENEGLGALLNSYNKPK